MDSDAFKVLERYCKRRYRHGSANFHVETSTATNFGSSVHQMSTDYLAQPSPFQSAHNIIEVIDTLSQKSAERSRCCCRFPLLKRIYEKFGVKYFAIIALTLAYALLGGLMFYHLEAQAETDRLAKLQKIIEQRQDILASGIHNLIESPSCFKQKSELFEPLNTKCKKKLMIMIRDYTDMVNFESCGPESKWIWDYYNAVFFALSLMTTIGYGNIHCKTYEGRMATIFYGLIGIPIMLIMLNFLGHFFFNNLQSLWDNARSCVKKKMKRMRKRMLRRKDTVVENPEEKVFDINEDSDISSEEDIFQTYPLTLALAIVFGYIMLCSFIVTIWEEWDWFTAFYFLFISMSTIGLGDEMPEHPHYASCFFIFFIIGLSLVSMCISMLQMRVENRYMQALQLIDEQRQTLFAKYKGEEPNENGNTNTIEPIVESPEDQNNMENKVGDSNMLGVRWRGNSRPQSSKTVSQKSLGDSVFSDPFFSSPILQTLLRYSHNSDPHNRMSSTSIQSIPLQRQKPSGVAPLAESENIEDGVRERL